MESVLNESFEEILLTKEDLVEPELPNCHQVEVEDEEEDLDEDVIVCWFDRGFHNILERVFLVLRLRTSLACLQVSTDWQRIVLHYNEPSEIPRLRLLQNQQIRNEWFFRDPIIEIAPLVCEDTEYIILSSYDMITDEQHVVIAVFTTTREEPQMFANKIFVLNSKNLSVLHALDVGNNPHSLSGAFAWIRLSMNDEVLVANTGHRMMVENLPVQYSQPYWFRRENFRKSCQNLENGTLPTVYSATSKEPLITETLFNTPILSKIGIYFPIGTYFEPTLRGLVYDSWTMTSGVQRYQRSSTITISKHCQDQRVDFLLVPLTEKLYYFTLESGLNTGGEIFEGCISLYCKMSAKLIWKRKMPNHSPKLIGFNEDFVAVVWADSSRRHGPIEVYNMPDGKLEQRLEFRNDLRIVYEAKFKAGRMAVHGLTLENTREVIVWDLESGQIILKSLQDLKLENPACYPIRFELEKKRLLLVHNKKIYVATFWI